MAANRYKDAVQCRLSEHILPNKFRTVTYDQLDIPGGDTEVFVEIMVKKETAKKLSFKVPRDGMLYGFARIRPEVKELFGADNAKIFINDWDSKFVMIYELDEVDEKAFFVTSDEVVDLLENCMRVPQQRISVSRREN